MKLLKVDNRCMTSWRLVDTDYGPLILHCFRSEHKDPRHYDVIQGIWWSTAPCEEIEAI